MDARLLETGGCDRTTERAMAERAGATVSYFNAGHLGLMSDPTSVTRIIERTAKETA